MTGDAPLEEVRRHARRALLGARSDREAIDAMVELLVPSAGDRVALHVRDGTSLHRVAGSEPADAEEASNAAVREAVVDDGTTLHADAGGSATWVLAPVMGHGGALGVVELRTGEPLADAEELLEHVADLLGAVMERTQLRDRTREAARRTQRVASQLHQLLAASIAIGGLQEEEEILASVAQRVRSVFDAEVAVATATTGAGAGDACYVALPGERAARSTVGAAGALHGLTVTPTLAAAGIEGEWLRAPLLARRGSAQGWFAVRRGTPTFEDDDVEVATLLAQTAASALASARLHHSVARNEARLRAIVDATPVAIVEHDVDGAIRWWNRAAGSLFGWGEPGGSGIDQVRFPPGLAEQLRSSWRTAAQGRAVVGEELAGVPLAERATHLTVGVVPLPDIEGRHGGLLTVAEDVTDQRQLMEELRHAQRMEVIGQLSSSVAHDFNNLLMLIAGYSELLTSELPGEDARSRQLVEDIQATTSRASTLTGKLLTMGRTKAPTPTVFSPVSSLRGIAEVLDRVVGPDVRLDLELDDATPHVRADLDQFEQTVINLATNARDAMPDGGTLRVSVAPFPADDSSPGVRIEVADTGTGMDEGTLRQCFEPLFTTKGPSRGTGLGLPAAKRVVTEAGGTITCTSVLGKGTTFEILLPGVAPEAPADVAEAPSPAAVQLSGTVLLAEDEDGIREMVERVLTRSGLDVLSVGSADEALALAEELDDGVDLLVSDVVMPGMTGDELARTLQSRWPSLRVVLMSGNVEDSAIAPLKAGSAAFLAKPFRPSAVLSVISELLADDEESPAPA